MKPKSTGQSSRSPLRLSFLGGTHCSDKPTVGHFGVSLIFGQTRIYCIYLGISPYMSISSKIYPLKRIYEGYFIYDTICPQKYPLLSLTQSISRVRLESQCLMPQILHLELSTRHSRRWAWWSRMRLVAA